MKKITLVAGLLLSALVLFGATGCSSGGGGGSDDDGVSYSSGSGSGSSSGGSGTRTYTSVAGGTFKYTSPLARSWQSYTFNADGTYVFNVSTGAGDGSTGSWTAEGTTIYINGIPFTANSSFTQISMSSAQVFTRQ